MFLICKSQGLRHISTQIHPPGLEYGLERRKLVVDSFADKIDWWEVVETSDGAFPGEVPVKRGIRQWEAEVVDAEAYLGGKIQEAHYHVEAGMYHM